MRSGNGKKRVSFFITCLGDALFPEIGKQSVQLLEKLGCEVSFNPKQTCCAQPLVNSGFHAKAKKSMRTLMDALLVGACEYIVAPSGSCVLQVKEFPEFFRGDPEWEPMAETLAGKIWEITDFIVTVLGITDVGARLKGRAAYHPSCHMTRLLGVKEPPLTLLANIKDLEMVSFPGQDKCCGFGGAFAVKLGPLSGAMVAEKVDNLVAAGVDYLIGADAGCLMNIEGRIRRQGHRIKVLHIVEALMTSEK
ncbi:MAG: Fe-S oxidoreductase [Desulfobacterales bacterium SG8_35]|nr:MAG: Fe-S oxidoreductase [Desulfobacterales bacterium SG8_35]